MRDKDKPVTDYSKPADEIDYETFIVEESDNSRVLRWRHTVNTRAKAGQLAGNKGADGYIRIRYKGKRYLAHRILWYLEYGRWPEKEIDHINGDTSDNRSCNLREVTSSQNMMNRSAPSTNTSGVKGVYWHRGGGKWQVQLRVNGKPTTFGLHSDLELAELIHKVAEEKYHGEYRRV